MEIKMGVGWPPRWRRQMDQWQEEGNSTGCGEGQNVRQGLRRAGDEEVAGRQQRAQWGLWESLGLIWSGGSHGRAVSRGITWVNFAVGTSLLGVRGVNGRSTRTGDRTQVRGCCCFQTAADEHQSQERGSGGVRRRGTWDVCRRQTLQDLAIGWMQRMKSGKHQGGLSRF